ncbi:tyrosine-type recombinase/integrase [Candidatus Gracilibacteria bacterium]|nr:tyrosine-type recombinase/integrase [Candidatus Gracilibacteria bacterium]NJP22404.1 tyrosine-type recombinase/integrase [Hydrococcus sp. CRU_1_1]
MSSLPAIKLIPLEPHKVSSPPPPTDLRSRFIIEFFQSQSLAPKTRLAYERELKRFTDWTDKPWSAIAPRQIAQYKAHLLEIGLAQASVNRALCTIKSFFGWLHKAYPDSVPINPTATVELEKLPVPEARDLSDEQIALLWQAIEQLGATKLRDAALLAVLLSGLREEEACNLNINDYDGVRLHIRKAKDDSTGTVPLAPWAKTKLEAYLAQRLETEGELLNESPMFLSVGHNSLGKRLGYQGLYYAIKKLGKLAGIENLTPHQLRHTFATMLMLKQMDSIHARTLTRHKSESSFKRYAKRAMAVAAEQAFFGAIGEENR